MDTDLSWVNGNWPDQSWSNPPLTNSNWAYPSWTNPSWVNPSWVNPSWVNPSWVNPSYSDPSWVNPSWVNPSWVNPSWVNPSWVNPSWVNPSWVNPSWVNSSMSDLTYTITNTGNTTTSYHVKMVGRHDGGDVGRSGAVRHPDEPDQVVQHAGRGQLQAHRDAALPPGRRGSRRPAHPGQHHGRPGRHRRLGFERHRRARPRRVGAHRPARRPMQQMAQLGSTIGVAAVPASYTPTATTYQDLHRAAAARPSASAGPRRPR